MVQDRKYEGIEDDRKKWKIGFDINLDPLGENSHVDIRFIRNNQRGPLTEKDLEKLKQDLKDLGKLRIIKQGKEFLGE